MIDVSLRRRLSIFPRAEICDTFSFLYAGSVSAIRLHCGQKWDISKSACWRSTECELSANGANGARFFLHYTSPFTLVSIFGLALPHR